MGLFVFFIVWFIQALVFGYICDSIIQNKGYNESWFLWGFLFGILAILVALSKPEVHRYSSSIYETPNWAKPEKMRSSNGWECAFCRTVNDSYVGTCVCGKTREESDKRKDVIEQYKKTRQIEEAKAPTDALHKELQWIEVIKQYKELLDLGAITNEEYEKKKNAILNRESIAKEEVEEQKDGWTCENCGEINYTETLCCKYCGKVQGF